MCADYPAGQAIKIHTSAHSPSARAVCSYQTHQFWPNLSETKLGCISAVKIGQQQKHEFSLPDDTLQSLYLFLNKQAIHFWGQSKCIFQPFQHLWYSKKHMQAETTASTDCSVLKSPLTQQESVWCFHFTYFPGNCCTGANFAKLHTTVASSASRKPVRITKADALRPQ